MSDGRAIAARPVGGPIIPPLETTAPTDLVAAVPHGSDDGRPGHESSDGSFSPLRADPPPTLVSTWWLRSAILLVLIGALAATLWVEFSGDIDDIATHPLVIGLHLVALGAIVVWSFSAMTNANHMVPPTLYRRRSNPLLTVILWGVAVAAPFVAARAFGVITDRFGESVAPAPDVSAVESGNDEIIQVVLLAAVVLVAFVLVWLPFRYHARQAARIGAPRRVMLAWFFAPLLAVVGGVAIMALGLQDELAVDGLTDIERVTQVGVVYGLPMLLFALSTWRAITVFDEVIDIRWRRWRTEWEQTIGDLARQPVPGPEDSPDVPPAV